MNHTADVLAIDLPWGTKATSRTAIAHRSATGIAVSVVQGDDELVHHVEHRAANAALVLLDVPIEGCEDLDALTPRRAVDDGFLRSGIPILPSVKSGLRGPMLAQRLLATRPDLRIGEIYPYAVLRVLWGLHREGRPFRLDDDATRIDLSSTWWDWPPKYKRATTRALKLDAMTAVADLLSRVPTIGGAIERPAASATVAAMAFLADRYDALMGLLAGIAEVDRSSWSWLGEGATGAGSIVTIADGSVRRRFERAMIENE